MLADLQIFERLPLHLHLALLCITCIVSGILFRNLLLQLRLFLLAERVNFYEVLPLERDGTFLRPQLLFVLADALFLGFRLWFRRARAANLEI